MAKKNRLKEVKVGLFHLVLVSLRSYQICTEKDLLVTPKPGKHFGIRSRLRYRETLQSLTNVDKFNYLRSLLDGPALSSITGLPLKELD